jgi:acetyltransferase-like isoleucine patch superfamily enzyme
MIHHTASLGRRVRLGENITIEANVKLGDGCALGHNVVIHSDTEIGNEVKIGDNTVIGRLPMRAKMSAVTKDEELSPTIIGDRVIVGSQVVIYRGCQIGSFILVADLASIRENVEVGDYTIIGRGVAVENKVRIGKKCKIETNAYICALSTIEDYCFIAPMVTFTNDNFLGRTEERFKYHRGPHLKLGSRIGANATILPGLVIGEDALVAAGSVVTKNVPSRKVVIGVPARVIRDVPVEQLLENQNFYEG